MLGRDSARRLGPRRISLPASQDFGSHGARAIQRKSGFEELDYPTGGVVRNLQRWQMPASLYDRQSRALDLSFIESAMFQRYKLVRFTPHNQCGSLDPI